MVGFHDLVGTGIAPVSKKNAVNTKLYVLKNQNSNIKPIEIKVIGSNFFPKIASC